MTGSTPQTLGTDRPQPVDVHRLEVTHVEQDAYTVDVRGHRLRVDQPLDAGGTDTAPTPTELFAASLATCVAFYAGRYPCTGTACPAPDFESAPSSPWPPTGRPGCRPCAS
ncbi:OsmC family protein [Streptomyces albogriseolus]|uniref:OsmC family protein n=1 Tax=Streptomyces albogriseolus TaxID=1887 RepID=UPI0033B0C57C